MAGRRRTKQPETKPLYLAIPPETYEAVSRDSLVYALITLGVRPAALEDGWLVVETVTPWDDDCIAYWASLGLAPSSYRVGQFNPHILISQARQDAVERAAGSPSRAWATRQDNGTYRCKWCGTDVNPAWGFCHRCALPNDTRAPLRLTFNHNVSCIQCDAKLGPVTRETDARHRAESLACYARLDGV